MEPLAPLHNPPGAAVRHVEGDVPGLLSRLPEKVLRTLHLMLSIGLGQLPNVDDPEFLSQAEAMALYEAIGQILPETEEERAQREAEEARQKQPLSQAEQDRLEEIRARMGQEPTIDTSRLDNPGSWQDEVKKAREQR